MPDSGSGLPPGQYPTNDQLSSYDPLLDCRDCWESYRWSSSWDEERCSWCAHLAGTEGGQS